MKIVFSTLATVKPAHAYYSGICEDLDFFPTPETQRLLQVGRMLAKMQEGSLVLLFENDAPKVPVSSIAGETLVFGLSIRNPYFDNITAPVLGPSRLKPYYANTADPTALDAPLGVEIVTGLHTLAPTLATRPVVLTLQTAAGDTLDTRTLGTGETSSSYDFRRLPPGSYTVLENYDGGASGEQHLLLDSMLYANRTWGVLAITIDEDFYTADTKPVFTLTFEPREETLRYYVVASNFPPAEFTQLRTQLALVDEGNNAEGGVPITFTKIVAPFPAGDIQDTLLDQGSQLLAIFESDIEVPRRERGLKKLHLNRNTTTLIDHLPLPRPEKAQADLIVLLSKP